MCGLDVGYDEQDCRDLIACQCLYHALRARPPAPSLARLSVRSRSTTIPADLSIDQVIILKSAILSESLSSSSSPLPSLLSDAKERGGERRAIKSKCIRAGDAKWSGGGGGGGGVDGGPTDRRPLVVAVPAPISVCRPPAAGRSVGLQAHCKKPAMTDDRDDRPRSGVRL